MILVPIAITVPDGADSDSASNLPGVNSNSGIWFWFRDHLQLSYIYVRQQTDLPMRTMEGILRQWLI